MVALFPFLFPPALLLRVVVLEEEVGRERGRRNLNKGFWLRLEASVVVDTGRVVSLSASVISAGFSVT